MRFVAAPAHTYVEPASQPQLAGSWRSNKPWIATALCAVLIFLALAIGTALTSRPITDEGLFADPAYTLATKGYMGSPALRDNAHLLRIEERTYWIFPLDPVLQAAWYRLFGVGLFAMRSLSICFGLLGLAALFTLVERLSKDSKIASLAVALTALDYFYMYGNASGRMDVMCAALGYAGLASYVALRERNLVLAVLVSHTLIVTSGITHPNGFLYFMGLVFLMLYCDRRRINLRHVALAAVPYAVGASLWGWYILQDPLAFLAQIKANASDGGRFQGLRNPLLGFVREITVRYASAYGFEAHSFGHEGPIYLKVLALCAYMAGIIGALSISALRRKTEVRVILSLITIWFIYLGIFDGQKAYYYLVHFIPMYAALLAVFVSWLLLNRKLNSKAVLLPLSLVVAIQVGGVAYKISLNSYKNIYQPAVEYLKQNARGSRLINANIAFQFGLGFPNNLVDDSHLNETADYFVIDNEVAQRLKNSRTGNPSTYRHVTDMLESCYEKVYDLKSVEIYTLRKNTHSICEPAEKNSTGTVNGPR
ncbi:MAG: family glycosyltransferase, 4-amino-4-deoxy-L-arabinose transferase [Acidobacteriaceae bacterium]|nr:family glycosyltransferase, 4-amino-4-deoxy-L-arabinose transferase [Acidobacteriaceae bacterium]